jgi:hypothetical protein
MTIDHITIFHARLKPTPEKVVKCLKLAEPLRLLDIRRRKVFQYKIIVIVICFRNLNQVPTCMRNWSPFSTTQIRELDGNVSFRNTCLTLLGYIPISICKSCMMVTIFSTTHIESTTLLEDFLLFVDLKDRNLIQEALNDFSALSEDQKQDLQNLFYQFEMGCILKEETFRDQLLNMARNELCLKPRSLCEKLRQGKILQILFLVLRQSREIIKSFLYQISVLEINK